MSLHDHERIRERLASVADPVGFLTNLFAHAPVGFGVWSADGRPLLTNNAFLEIFRVEPPPEYNVLKDEQLAASGMLTFFQRAFRGETVRVPTFWYDPRELTSIAVTEGRRVAISMTIFPLFRANGEIEYVAATYKDETEMMLAAERHRVSDERLRLAHQVARAGTFEWNVQTDIHTWTPELEAMHGLAPGQFGATFQSWEALVHPDDRAEALACAHRAFETLAPTEGEWRVVWPDGSVHWLIGRFQLFADQDGQPHRLIGVNLDITSRKEEDSARQLAEIAVAEREEDLRITLDSIGDAVIATDASGRITRMNPVAERLTGWRLTEARGRDLADVFCIFDEDTRKPAESPVERVLREGVVVGLANHTLLVSRDGTERAIADSGAPIRGADGRVRGVVLVFHDQTAERAAERALQRSEARFRRLAEAGIIGIITADIFGNILEANDAFLHTVGYTAQEVRAGSVRWSDMTPREWLPLDDRAIVQLEATGIATAWEKEYFRKDGTRVPIMVGVAMLDMDTGEFIAFTVDLTERKRAEEALQRSEAALRESEARKAAVMEAALDAIVLMDHEGKITELNAAAERTFGYARDEVVGQALADVMIPPALRERHRGGLRRYLETGEGTILGKRIEVEATKRDGATFPAEVAVVRIRSQSSPVFTGYIRDITERRRAAEAELLQREKDAAYAANRELEAFSYSVAHDLRAPLRGISGFSVALLEDHGQELSDGAKALFAKVTASAARMGELIDALLSLARLSRIELRREAVDLTEIAVSVVEQLRSTDPGREVEFVAMNGVTARGDRRLLRSVLENLLGNAWKFTRNEPLARIEFGYARQPDGVRYYVRDNGAGFDMAYAKRLFSPFQRLHTSAQFEGTGIGLATVQRIVQRHGGHVWAEGQENEGATFLFSLPQRAPPTSSWFAAR